MAVFWGSRLGTGTGRTADHQYLRSDHRPPPNLGLSRTPTTLPYPTLPYPTLPPLLPPPVLGLAWTRLYKLWPKAAHGQLVSCLLVAASGWFVSFEREFSSQQFPSHQLLIIRQRVYSSQLSVRDLGTLIIFNAVHCSPSSSTSVLPFIVRLGSSSPLVFFFF